MDVDLGKVEFRCMVKVQDLVDVVELEEEQNPFERELVELCHALRDLVFLRN